MPHSLFANSECDKWNCKPRLLSALSVCRNGERPLTFKHTTPGIVFFPSPTMVSANKRRRSHFAD